MAISPEDKYALIEVGDEWFDFRVAMEDKCCCLYGKNKNEPGNWATEGDYSTYDELVIAGCGFERYRSDLIIPEIIGIGVHDRDHKKYLIIKLEHLSE